MAENENITSEETGSLVLSIRDLYGNDFSFPTDKISGITNETTKEEFDEKYKETNVDLLQKKAIFAYLSRNSQSADKVSPGFCEKYGSQLEPFKAALKKGQKVEIPAELCETIKKDISDNFDNIYTKEIAKTKAARTVGNGSNLDAYCEGNTTELDSVFPGFTEKYGKEVKKYAEKGEYGTVCKLPEELRQQIIQDYVEQISPQIDWKKDNDRIYTQKINEYNKNQYIEQTVFPEFSQVKDMTNIVADVSPQEASDLLKKTLPFPEEKFMATLIPMYKVDEVNNAQIQGLDTAIKPEHCKLSLEDYEAVALANKIDIISRKMAVLCAEGKYEEADKIIPGFSEKYKNDINKNDKNINYSGETSNNIKKDVLENFDKIYPNFKTDCVAKYNADREANNITDTMTITDNQLALLMTDYYPTKETADVASENRKNIQEILNRLSPAKTNEQAQENTSNDISAVKKDMKFARQLHDNGFSFASDSTQVSLANNQIDARLAQSAAEKTVDKEKTNKKPFNIQQSSERE